MAPRKPAVKAPQGRSAVRNAITISGGAALTLGAALSPSLEAATFTVANLNDSGAGSLRQAVLDANAAAGADVVDFQGGLTGTVTLTTGEIAISDTIDIQGPGESVVTVSGNNASQVFYLNTDSIDVTISNLTLTEGSGTRGGALYLQGDGNILLQNLTITNSTAGDDGGALMFDSFGAGSLTIQDCTITGNSSLYGGGIYIEDTPAGGVLIANTTISGNTADTRGGGIYIYDPDSDVTIRDSTISGNTTTSRTGGGIYVYSFDTGGLIVERTTITGNTAATDGGGIYFYDADEPTSRVINSTISGNTALGNYGGGIHVYSGSSAYFVVQHSTIAGNTSDSQGGGIYLAQGDMLIENSIVADNTTGFNNPDLGGGTFYLGDSLVEDPDGATIVDNGGNLLNVDPVLGPLANNGGPTQTHLLLAGSPAIDAGDPGFVGPPNTDQRGASRIVGGRVDMGATESGAGGTVEFSVTNVAVTESALTVTLTVTRTGLTGGAISVDFASTDGTAIAPGDYTAAAGTLNWADGDGASQDIVITIANDGLVEVPETFTVTLSNPGGGAVLGVNDQATVTISDAAVAPATAIPTLGFWGKLAMIIGAAWVGLLGLGRRLFTVLMISAMASIMAVQADAAPRPDLDTIRSVDADRPSVLTRIDEVTSRGNLMTLRLEGERVITADASTIKILDYREATVRAAKANRNAAATEARAVGRTELRKVKVNDPFALHGVAPGQVAIVTVKTNKKTGETKKVIVRLFDSEEDARASVEPNKD